MTGLQQPGVPATTERGWFAGHKWLLARRFSQFAILGLFLLGPWFGIWTVKGNLTSSRTLDVLPLTDPFIFLQSLATGYLPELTAIIGALLVVAFYLLVGGRVFCAWVCPVNIVTDTAHWLRRRLGINAASRLSPNARYWLLAAVLLLALITGSLAWELVNPVSLLHRGLIFGMGFGWLIILAIFLFDLLVSRRGWCGHLCPMGAFYSALGTHSLLRVRTDRREHCNDCMDCYAVCPEPQVIRPALKGEQQGRGPVISSAHCTNCGRCIDVCSKEVFTFGGRFHNRPDASRQHQHSAGMEVPQ